MSSIRRRSGALAWTLSIGHHRMLLALLQQLDRAIDGPTDDPIVARLFPRMVEDDDDADAELRMLMAGDLLLRRHNAIRRMVEILEQAVPGRGERVVARMHDDEPAVMLAVLNDIRLALGARVGSTAVELRQLVEPDDVETHQVLDAMDLLAWFQMQLLEHIDPVAASHDGYDEA